MAVLNKGANTRIQIISQATKIFGTQGYSKSSFKNIADACAITQSAVLYHFNDKLSLFKAVVSSTIEENGKLVSDLIGIGDDAYEKLIKHFEGNYTWAVKHKHNAQIMTCIYHLATYDREFQLMYSEILKAAREKIHAHLLSGEREKLSSFSAPPELVAQTLHDQLLGMLLNTVTSSPRHNSYVSSKRKWILLIELFTKKG